LNARLRVMSNDGRDIDKKARQIAAKRLAE
jgi:hypothetical protein